MNYWILRNTKTLLGLFYFFTSEYATMDYLLVRNYSYVDILIAMFTHIFIFISFLIIIKFEQDSGIDLYNPPPKPIVPLKNNIIEKKFTVRLDTIQEDDDKSTTQVQN